MSECKSNALIRDLQRNRTTRLNTHTQNVYIYIVYVYIYISNRQIKNPGEKRMGTEIFGGICRK